MGMKNCEVSMSPFTYSLDLADGESVQKFILICNGKEFHLYDSNENNEKKYLISSWTCGEKMPSFMQRFIREV